MNSIIYTIIIIAIISAVFIHKKKHSNNANSNVRSQTAIPQRNTVSYNTNQQNTGDSMTETGVMEYFANTRHNEKDLWFRFNYKKVGNEWRAYIVRMPSLRGRDANPHLTHRYSDSNGNYWVCRDPMPTNLKDCQNISKVWADRLVEYISTGIEANSQRW